MDAIIVALNHHEIGTHPERISKILPHIPKYIWDRINFSSQRKDWEIFERNNEDNPLSILSLP